MRLLLILLYLAWLAVLGRVAPPPRLCGPHGCLIVPSPMPIPTPGVEVLGTPTPTGNG